MSDPIDLGDELTLEADGSVKKGSAEAVPDDVPVRNDLPVGHPLRGQRVLKVVPSGWVDCVVSEKGMLEKYTKTVEPAPEPVVTTIERG